MIAWGLASLGRPVSRAGVRWIVDRRLPDGQHDAAGGRPPTSACSPCPAV